jgi:hypothetical protein
MVEKSDRKGLNATLGKTKRPQAEMGVTKKVASEDPF